MSDFRSNLLKIFTSRAIDLMEDGTLPKLEDGEVINIDSDGCLICWNAETQEPYNCGETREQYGEHNLTDRERHRLSIRLTTTMGGV